MIARLRFCVAYFAYWMAFYAVARLLFLAYHHTETAHGGLLNAAGAMLHGARMDLAAAAGPCLLVFPLVALSVFAPKIATRLIIGFSVVALVVVAIVATVDVELFRAWGYRIDGSVLQYFNTPREMISSSRSSPLLLLAALLLLFASAAVTAFLMLFRRRLTAWERVPYPVNLAAIPLGAALFTALYVPLHGGIQKQPIKQSTVYFSQNLFANQAALNVTWNFIDGVWHRSYVKTNPYRYLATAEAARIVDSLLAPDSDAPPHLLRIARPNVLLILWESWTAKVVGREGGVPGVTPNVDSLIHDGVLFDHFYASGYRSPRGLVAVLSGYPSQPTSEIILEPKKSASLPALPHQLGAVGYHSRFYYGGDPAFSNFRSYLMAAGYDTLITDGQFEVHAHHTEWGEDDEVVLARLLADVPQMRRPFFTTIFTLSSHEPFDVPMQPVIPGTDERSRFLNAQAYADRSIGDFVRAARRQPWWDSTLIVIVADHGHRLPILDSLQPLRQWEIFSIPMLWIGGALAVHDTIVTGVGGQTDIPATLLHQLGLSASPYPWSRDLLAPRAQSWAWFSFNDGFGFMNGDGGGVTWDNIGRRALAVRDPHGTNDIRNGEAILQRLMDDYMKR